MGIKGEVRVRLSWFGTVRSARLISLFPRDERLILTQGGIRVIPATEVVRLSLDLLCPSPCGMGEKGEIGARLGGFAGSSLGNRMRIGHGNGLLKCKVAVFKADPLRPDRPFILIVRSNERVSSVAIGVTPERTVRDI
jgi:hypothetical protein